MAIQTTRTNEHNPQDNYIEVTTGNIVATVEMHQNARGKWQPSIKMNFTSIPDAKTDSATIAAEIVADLKAKGFQLADE